MWRDHPFSQRNRTTERTRGLGVGDDRKVKGGWTKLWPLQTMASSAGTTPLLKGGEYHL